MELQALDDAARCRPHDGGGEGHMPLYWLYDARLERWHCCAGCRVQKIEKAPAKPLQSVTRQPSGTVRPPAAIFEFLHGLGQEPPFAVEVKQRMKIGNFINNKKLVDDWLAEQAKSLEMAGFTLSHWPHHDGLGFGIVITADKSGEFHLMPNCDVCSHVETYNPQTHEFDVLHSDWRPTAHFHEFEQLFNLFKKNVIT